MSSTAPAIADWRSRPRPSSGSPRPPTATASSMAGSPGSASKPGSGTRRRAGEPGVVPAGLREPLDPETVAAILAEESLLADPASTVDAIARAVAARFGVRLGVLRGPSRSASVVEARHLAIHLARTLTGSSFAAIGTYFGGRDPATVRHACKAAADRINADPALAAVVAALARGWQKPDA